MTGREFFSLGTWQGISVCMGAKNGPQVVLGQALVSSSAMHVTNLGTTKDFVKQSTPTLDAERLLTFAYGTVDLT